MSTGQLGQRAEGHAYPLDPKGLVLSAMRVDGRTKTLVPVVPPIVRLRETVRNGIYMRSSFRLSLTF